MRFLIISSLLLSNLIYSQTLNQDYITRLSEFLGKTPNEFQIYYKLSDPETDDNFGEKTSKYSGLRIDREDCQVKVISVNNLINEIEVQKLQNNKEFFYSIGTNYSRITDDKENNYKISHKAYTDTKDFPAKFEDLITKLRTTYPLNLYIGFARFNNMDYKLELELYDRQLIIRLWKL